MFCSVYIYNCPNSIDLGSILINNVQLLSLIDETSRLCSNDIIQKQPTSSNSERNQNIGRPMLNPGYISQCCAKN